jgi:hypothetical protein
MAIRLTFDVIGSTCGDLFRFADAVRAAGAEPDNPLQQSSGPNRVEVVVDDRGGPPQPFPGRVTQLFPPPVPPQGPPHVYPPHVYPAHGFTMSGSFPPGFGPGVARPVPEGCSIEVSFGDGRSHGTHVPPETVDRWRTALDKAIATPGTDESTRTSLLHLRNVLSQEPGGS